VSPVSQALEYIGGAGILAWQSLRLMVRRPFEMRLILNELYNLGVMSLSIALVTLLFTGMVIAVQTSYTLAAYGAKVYVAKLVSLSIVLELGPVLTALMLAARVGAGITADIGSMKVTEQVDALRALAADPVKKLVVPKLVALLIMVPVLTILAITIGILGGLVMAITDIGQTTQFYLQQVWETVLISDLFRGLGKTPVFALFIAIIACHNGLNATGGAEGVGRATRNTVVLTAICIFISNFFLAKLYIWL
jgi:phospholipid/cholesterol/gamma-HCH transport system permease protein